MSVFNYEKKMVSQNNIPEFNVLQSKDVYLPINQETSFIKVSLNDKGCSNYHPIPHLGDMTIQFKWKCNQSIKGYKPLLLIYVDPCTIVESIELVENKPCLPIILSHLSISFLSFSCRIVGGPPHALFLLSYTNVCMKFQEDRTNTIRTHRLVKTPTHIHQVTGGCQHSFIRSRL